MSDAQITPDGRTVRPWKRDDFDPADHVGNPGVAQATPKKAAAKKAAATADD